MILTLPAFSVWQPHAWALLPPPDSDIPPKRIETRSWYTKYRGPILIHASKHRVSVELFRSVWMYLGRYYPRCSRAEAQKLLPYGEIIAIGELVDCLPVTMRNGVGTLCLPSYPHNRRDLSALETALGDYTPGRFGWLLDNVRPIPQPIPYRGRQGLFNVPVEILPVEYRPKEAA